MKIVEAEYKDVRSKYPDFKAGDTINVHVKIREGNKERIQQFQGTPSAVASSLFKIPTFGAADTCGSRVSPAAGIAEAKFAGASTLA